MGVNVKPATDINLLNHRSIGNSSLANTMIEAISLSYYVLFFYTYLTACVSPHIIVTQVILIRMSCT